MADYWKLRLRDYFFEIFTEDIISCDFFKRKINKLHQNRVNTVQLSFDSALNTLWRACNLTSFSPCLTGPVDYLFASHHKGPRFKTPGGYFCETGILLLVMSCYICDPDVTDHHCGLIWGRPRPEPSLGPRADNVVIPLDLTQLSCSGFTLAAGLPSGFTTTESAAGGEPCGELAISLHSHHVSLVQWTTCLLPITRDPGSKPLGGTYVKPGISC